MLEQLGVERATEFAIDPIEQVQVEASRDAIRIVLGFLEGRAIFTQIDSDEQPIFGAEIAPKLRREVHGFIPSEISDRRSEPQN